MPKTPNIWRTQRRAAQLAMDGEGAKVPGEQHQKDVDTPFHSNTGLILAARLTKAIERELDLIDEIVGRPPARHGSPTEGERRARMLASLAKTLTELKKQQGNAQRPLDDDDRPRDLDELRRRLSARLADKLGEQASRHTGEHDTERD